MIVRYTRKFCVINLISISSIFHKIKFACFLDGNLRLYSRKSTVYNVWKHRGNTETKIGAFGVPWQSRVGAPCESLVGALDPLRLINP